MNNTVLRIISAILALGAIAVAYFAIRLSQAPAPAPIAQKASDAVVMEAVAVTTRGLRAGQVIVAADVAVKALQHPPGQAYRQIQDVVGRVPVSDIASGTPLTPSLFAADSIAYLLKPGERAVAIQIDEIASVGGFIKPGDTVDVLSYFPQGNDNQTSAQVVLQNVKLLTVGNVSQLEEIEKAQSSQDSLIKPSSGGISTDIKSSNVDERRLRMRSAVLAVRDNDVNRLMLAANAGMLRLALRPPIGSDPNASLDQSKAPTANRPAVALLGDMTVRKGGSTRKYVVQTGSKEREVTDEMKAPR